MRSAEQRSTCPFLVDAAGLTDVGRVRDHNEDSYIIRTDLELFVLADGAGGHNAGEVASALATRSVVNYFEATEASYRDKPERDEFGLWAQARRLACAVHKANHDVIEISSTSRAHRGMGTTIVAARLSSALGLFHLSHVGDSRCYRLRHDYLEQLTEDHSLIVDVLELRPDIDDAALARLPANVITRALGMDPGLRVPVHTLELCAGDRYLLCSDGLTNKLSHRELCARLSARQTPTEIASELVGAANRAGGDDNIAVIVLACEHAPETEGLERPAGLSSSQFVPEAASIARDDSVPEIMLIGLEEVDLESAPIRVVPAESSSADLLDAVEELIRPLRIRPNYGATVCPQCGEPVDTPYCPSCGSVTALKDDEET